MINNYSMTLWQFNMGPNYNNTIIHKLNRRILFRFTINGMRSLYFVFVRF